MKTSVETIRNVRRDMEAGIRAGNSLTWIDNRAVRDMLCDIADVSPEIDNGSVLWRKSLEAFAMQVINITSGSQPDSERWTRLLNIVAESPVVAIIREGNDAGL